MQIPTTLLEKALRSLARNAFSIVWGKGVGRWGGGETCTERSRSMGRWGDGETREIRETRRIILNS
ncbi:hypothetical protein [Nostoc linckia]|uniref:hypothetical protein n=1 Tax=Nostoc linckia TaxID=92942 RepID=UPI0015D486D2|nr:hypothetical protein [Nostoc linckia]